MLGGTFQRTSLIYAGTAWYMSRPLKLTARIAIFNIIRTFSEVGLHFRCPKIVPINLSSCVPLPHPQFLSVHPMRCIQEVHHTFTCYACLDLHTPLSFPRVATATRICSSADWLLESELAFLPVFCAFHVFAEKARSFFTS